MTNNYILNTRTGIRDKPLCVVN